MASVTIVNMSILQEFIYKFNMITIKISPGIPQIPHHPEFSKQVYGRVKVQESQANLEGNKNKKFIYYKAIIIRTMSGISQVSLLG